MRSLRGGDADGGEEKTKAPEKRKYVPPAFRTFVLVRRENDVWIPLRQYSAQSPRNVALKVKVPSGSIVNIQDPVDGKVHVYKTLIENIPEQLRTQVQRDRNITTKKKVYKQAMYACPPCSEAARREKKISNRKREQIPAEVSDSESSDEETSDSSETSSAAPSVIPSAADDMATELAVENFLAQRRERQRAKRELQDMIDEDEESHFFEADTVPGQKRKR